MAKMMEVFYNGKLIGTCDAKCYLAKHGNCECVCQGALHRKPKNVAIRHLRSLKVYYRLIYPENKGYKIKFY